MKVEVKLYQGELQKGLNKKSGLVSPTVPGQDANLEMIMQEYLVSGKAVATTVPTYYDSDEDNLTREHVDPTAVGSGFDLSDATRMANEFKERVKEYKQMVKDKDAQKVEEATQKLEYLHKRIAELESAENKGITK